MELSVQQAPAALDRRERGVTPRVIVLCLLLALGFGYAIPVVDYKFSNTFLGATHLPPGAIAALLLLLLANPLLRIIANRAAFGRNEMLTVYLSCLFSCLVPGIGGNNYWVSYIIGTFYYATRENHWLDFLKGLPPWFTPALNADGTYNRFVAEAWNTGLAPGQTIPWGVWVVPLVAWGAFFFASFTMLACLASMLAAQWNDREALAFPLLRLPLAMTSDAEAHGAEKIGFFQNDVMWCGFGVAAAFQLINGLHLYFPDVPQIATYVSSSPFFTEAPWNQIGSASIYIYPIAIGIAFLLTTEVSFSFWFFFWVFKAQLVMAYLSGFPPNSLPSMLTSDGPQFTGYQEVGASFMYFGLILWAARRHFAHIAARAVGRADATAEEKSEPLSYPVAFWGFIVSFGFMVAWGVAAGISLPLSLLLWTMYLVIAVVLSRVVAEGGLLFVHHTWAPLGSLAPLLGVGSGTLLSSSHGLASASFMEFATMEDYRGNLMPSFVQSFKLARERGIAARSLLALIFGVIVVGMVMSFTMNVRLGYQNGGLSLQSWFSRWGAQELSTRTAKLLGDSQGISAGAWGWLGVGMAMMFAIVTTRARFAWFPLHPLGYLMGLTLPMQFFWFSMLVGWSCKTLISKYGGPDSVRQATPFFLGLVLGDVAMMLFWLVVDGWQGLQGHQLMPG